MKYRKLGKSTMNVSQLCMGCMSFGKDQNNPEDWHLNLEDSKALVKKALELGINFFDTANVYAGGKSEEYLGIALKEYARREDVYIATKVYFNEGRLSKDAIFREVELSLNRLGTDYIDLYIIHRFDDETPIEKTMEALHELVVSGKVRALGASAMYAFQFQQMQNIALNNGWTPFVSMQNHYNLIYREDEREMIPYCLMTDVALTPYSPLAAGRLSRESWVSDTPRFNQDTIAISKYDSTIEADRLVVDRVRDLSIKYGSTMTQIALAWQIKKGITSPIVGITKPHYLEDAVGALSIDLTQEDVEYLEELYIPHRVVGANPVRINKHI